MEKVLLASSMGADRSLFENFFREKPQELEVATNGIEAYDTIVDHGDDLVIGFVNAGLPIRPGLDLVRIVKSSSKFSHIPLVLLVDKDDDERAEEAKKSWAEHVIQRPLDQFSLKQYMNKYALDKPLSALGEE